MKSYTTTTDQSHWKTEEQASTSLGFEKGKSILWEINI